MIEETGNIWHSKYNDDWRVIPINCTLNPSGHLIMDAGLAKDAKLICPWLPIIWSYQMHLWVNPEDDEYGRIFNYMRHMDGLKFIGFPTKYRPQDKADLNLIEKCLSDFARRIKAGDFDDDRIVIPHLGCGEKTGQLKWERVKPIIEKYLHGLNVLIVTKNAIAQTK